MFRADRTAQSVALRHEKAETIPRRTEKLEQEAERRLEGPR